LLVKNPCFSINARGLLGGFILFQKKYKQNTVNIYLLKRDRKTFPRLTYRAEWGICVSRWRCANKSMKAYFNVLGRVFDLGGNQYHMKEYFDLIKNNNCGYAICNISRCGE